MKFFVDLMMLGTCLAAALAIVGLTAWVPELVSGWLPDSVWGRVFQVVIYGVCIVAALVVLIGFVIPGIHDYWMDGYARYRATCCYG